MNEEKNQKKGGFWDLIKNLFWLLLILQFAPMVFTNIKKYFKDAVITRAHVGSLTIRTGLLTSADFYVKKIHKFLKDPEIKALFLKIDCSGGLPGASQAIFNELNKFKKEKPVVVFIENICASGGYYIAAAADHIVATPSSMIGSIGVVLNLANVKELLSNWNVKFDYIQSGKFKTAGSPLKEQTSEELSYLQKLSDGNYKQFIKDIAQSRNLNEKDFKTWADGKVFLGTEALKLKLIDQVGSYQDAIDEIKKLAQIETEIKFVKPKTVSGLARLFYGEEENDYDNSGFSSKMASFLNEVYIKFMEKQVENKGINFS